MSYTYWLHEKVQKDFDEAYEWYEDKKIGLGNEFLSAVEDKIAEIVANPTYFGSKGNTKYREAFTGRFPFIIVYLLYPEREKILICAVHNAKKSIRGKYRNPNN